jgi:hypothetical protein
VTRQQAGCAQEAKLCATGVSITGMSPSTSLKRDRLMQRNAILRRTGFIESGVPLKGTFAGVLPCKLREGVPGAA